MNQKIIILFFVIFLNLLFLSKSQFLSPTVFPKFDLSTDLLNNVLKDQSLDEGQTYIDDQLVPEYEGPLDEIVIKDLDTNKIDSNEINDILDKNNQIVTGLNELDQEFQDADLINTDLDTDIKINENFIKDNKIDSKLVEQKLEKADEATKKEVQDLVKLINDYLSDLSKPIDSDKIKNSQNNILDSISQVNTKIKDFSKNIDKVQPEVQLTQKTVDKQIIYNIDGVRLKDVKPLKYSTYANIEEKISDINNRYDLYFNFSVQEEQANQLNPFRPHTIDERQAFIEQYELDQFYNLQQYKFEKNARIRIEDTGNIVLKFIPLYSPTLFKFEFSGRWPDLTDNFAKYATVAIENLAINQDYQIQWQRSDANDNSIILQINYTQGIRIQSQTISVSIDEQGINNDIGQGVRNILQSSNFESELDFYIACPSTQQFSPNDQQCVNITADQENESGSLKQGNPRHIKIIFQNPLFDYQMDLVATYTFIKILGLEQVAYNYTFFKIFDVNNNEQPNNSRLLQQQSIQQKQGQTILIVFNFLKEVVGQKVAYIQVNIPEDIRKREGLDFTFINLYLELVDYYIISAGLQQAINVSASTSEITNQVGTGLGLAGTIVSTGGGITPRLMSMLGSDMIIRFTDVNFPPSARQTFLVMGEGYTLVYDYRFKRDFKDQKLINKNFEIYNLSPYFLDNFGEIVIQLIILALLGISVFYFNKIIKINELTTTEELKRGSRIRRLYVTAYRSIAWSLPITYLLSQFTEYCLFVFVNLKFAPLNSKQGKANFIIGIVGLIILIYFIIHIYVVIYISRKNSLYSLTNYDEAVKIAKEQEQIHGDIIRQQTLYRSQSLVRKLTTFYQPPKGTQTLKFLQRHAVFHLDYKNDNWFTQFYVFLDIMRQVFITLIIVFYVGKAYVQLTIIILINISFIVYICIEKPFIERSAFYFQLGGEILILFAYICALILAILDHQQKFENTGQRMFIGQLLTYSYILLIFQIVIKFAVLFISYFFYFFKVMAKYETNEKSYDQKNKESINENSDTSDKKSIIVGKPNNDQLPEIYNSNQETNSQINIISLQKNEGINQKQIPKQESNVKEMEISLFKNSSIQQNNQIEKSKEKTNDNKIQVNLYKSISLDQEQNENNLQKSDMIRSIYEEIPNDSQSEDQQKKQDDQIASANQFDYEDQLRRYRQIEF